MNKDRLKKLAGINEADYNALEDDDIFNDVPSIRMSIQNTGDEDILFLEVSAFCHGGRTGKISILKGDKALQQEYMENMQAEMQATFRRVTHSLLGEPYGIQEKNK